MKYIQVYNEMMREIRLDPGFTYTGFCNARGINRIVLGRWITEKFGITPRELKKRVLAGRHVRPIGHVAVSFPIELTDKGIKLIQDLGKEPSFAKMYDNLKYVIGGIGVADFTFDNLMIEFVYAKGKPKCVHNIVLPTKLQLGVHFKKADKLSGKVKGLIHEYNLQEQI